MALMQPFKSYRSETKSVTMEDFVDHVSQATQKGEAFDKNLNYDSQTEMIKHHVTTIAHGGSLDFFLLDWHSASSTVYQKKYQPMHPCRLLPFS